MKKVLFFTVMLSVVSVSARAQSVSYSGVSFVANGFRTVSEENAYMEQAMAERRQREQKESKEYLVHNRPASVLETRKGTTVKTKSTDRSSMKRSSMGVTSR